MKLATLASILTLCICSATLAAEGAASQPAQETPRPRAAGPASQPEFGPELPDAEAKKVADYLNGNGMQHIYPAAVKRASLGKTVTVTVQTDKSGWVKKALVRLPADAPYLELKRELEDAIVGMEIPDIQSAGSATVQVKLGSPRTDELHIGVPDMHWGPE